MRFNRFGRTGLFVSEIALGTATFGGGTGLYRQVGALQQAEADRLLGIALEAGINLIDTADSYAEGLSEQITGQALRNLRVPRDEVVVATKGFDRVGASPNALGSSRYHIMEAVKASLRRMQLDHIDIYWLHGFDPATPVEETLGTLDDLVHQGAIRYIGASNWASWQIAKALGVSLRCNLARIEAHQAYYSIAGRDIEREGIPMLQSEDVGLVVWGPLAGGLLSGKYRAGGDGRRHRFDFPPVDCERVDRVLEAMQPIASARTASIAQIAIAWLLHRSAVDSVIVGATREDQLRENIAAAAVDLSEPELELLDDASRISPEYPGWMLELKGAPRREQLRAARSSRRKCAGM